MILYRFRGLITLHVLLSTALATGAFLILAKVINYLPGLSLLTQVNLILYSASVVTGMLMSRRFFLSLAGSYHTMGWAGASTLAGRQVLAVALIIFAVEVATKDRTMSRLFLAHYLVLVFIILAVTNKMLPARLTRAVFSNENQVATLFIGNVAKIERFRSWINKKTHLGLKVVGYLAEHDGGEKECCAGPCLGKRSDLQRVLTEKKVSQVVLLETPSESHQMTHIVELCQSAGCRLLIYDNILDRMPVPMIAFNETGLHFLTVQEEPLEDPANRALKRAFDIMVSLPVVVLILPLLCLAVWIMQRIQSPGPLLFVRPRGGRQGSEFPMYKFRSMRHAAPNAAAEAVQARHGDDRIYGFGQMLRKTSLDEFPQFWNVLVGHMSIVGPRPHLPKHDYEFAQIAKAYRTRHLVKPGITGLAQVRGFRGEINDPALLHRRVELDLYYITNWSIWLDIGIVFATAMQLVRPPNTAR